MSDDRPASEAQRQAGLAAALAEYSALRAEILSDLSSKNSVLTFGLTTIGAIVTVGGLTNTSDNDKNPPEFLLAVPFVSLVVVILYFAISYRVNEIGTYIADECWPQVLELTKPAYSASWETYRAPKSGKNTATNIPLTVFFEIGIVGLFVGASLWCVYASKVSGGLFCVGFLASIAVGIVAVGIVWATRKRTKAAEARREEATITVATGIFLDRDHRLTLGTATARLHELAENRRLSAFEMATVIIDNPLAPEGGGTSSFGSTDEA